MKALKFIGKSFAYFVVGYLTFALLSFAGVFTFTLITG